jgi:tyrosine-protein kinase Etk/Wzc
MKARENFQSQIQHYLPIIYGSRWYILVTFVLVVASVGFYTYMQKNVYETKTTVRVLKGKKSLGNPFAVIPEFEGVGQDRDVGNELTILKSYTLARDAAEKLLDTAKTGVLPLDAFPIVRAQSEPSRFSRLLKSVGILSLLDWLGMSDESTLARTNPFASVDAVAQRVHETVKVEQETGLDVIDITAESTIPREAMLLANAVATAYYQRNLRSAREATTFAREFLENQQHQKKADLDDVEKRLQSYQQKEGIVSLDEESKALIERLSTSDAKLNEASIELQTAQKVQESYKRQLAEQEPNLAKNLSDAIADPYIKALQLQIADLQVQRDLATAQSSVTQTGRGEYFRDLFQKSMGEVNQKIQALQEKLKEKTDELLKSNLAASSPIETIRELAQKVIGQEIQISALEAKEKALSVVVRKYSAEFGKIPEKNIRFAQVERERRSDEKLYLMVQEKYQESLITEQSQFGNVEFVDPAREPTKPVRPTRFLNMVISIILGLGLGIGSAIALSYVNTTVRSPDDVEDRGFTVLSIVPPMELNGNHEPQGKLVTYTDPQSIAAESYHTLTTSILNSLDGEEQGKIIVVSSPGPSEGKSTTAANLAIDMADSRYKTILVESDLRRPTIHRLFNVKAKPGLTDYLLAKRMGSKSIQADKVDVTAIFRKTDIPNLGVIPAGSIPENPAELLRSHEMINFIEMFRKAFDIVIFDTPPLLTVTDAMILSRHSDGVLLVVTANASKMAGLERSRQILDQAGVNLLGVLINKFELRGSYGYHYYQYGYYHGANGAKEEVRRKLAVAKSEISPRKILKKLSAKS